MSARRRSRKFLARLASPSLTTFATLAATLLGTLTLAGCGQMGPLVLPGSASDESAADTGTAAGNATASGSGDEAEESNESGAENEQ